MKRLCIIPCGAKKIWDKTSDAGSTEAKDAYLSPFHKACQRYATTFFDCWVILSAKHGFLFPHDTLHTNYDVSFSSKSDEIISIERLKEQAVERNLHNLDEVVVLGGKKYRRVVEQIFGDEANYNYPLRNCKGIGYMIQKLNNALSTNEEIKK